MRAYELLETIQNTLRSINILISLTPQCVRHNYYTYITDKEYVVQGY